MPHNGFAEGYIAAVIEREIVDDTRQLVRGVYVVQMFLGVDDEPLRCEPRRAPTNSQSR